MLALDREQLDIAEQIIDVLSEQPGALEVLLNQQNKSGPVANLYLIQMLSIVILLIELKEYCVLTRNIITDLNHRIE